MLELLAASHNIQEQNGMIGIYNPLGIFTLFGIIYLIICIVLTIYKGDLVLEFKGLVIVFALWFSLSYFFVFGGGGDGGGRYVTTLDGVEVTRVEIQAVLDFFCQKRPDWGNIDDNKYKIIKKHLKTKPMRRDTELTYGDKIDIEKGRMYAKGYEGEYEIWELDPAGDIGRRLAEDFDYYYKQPGRDAGVPSSVYHPTMWFWCPIIAMVFSRPLWCFFFLARIMDRS